jgi:hypothetical protein|tara:strand:+ start:1203 stop:2063 length:861 start_codon:yes stop_codon:yes gene_type:complete
MATVNLGNIKFNWKGAYNNSTAYVVDDVVSNSGSSYICILASTGNAPTNTTYWQQMSAAGTNGTDVGTTITTQGDLLYRDGSGLQRLAAGTAGHVLQTGGAGANPSWTAVSSDYVKITDGTFSTSADNLVLDGFTSSTYKTYVLRGNCANTGNDGNTLRLRFRNGSTDLNSEYLRAGSYAGINTSNSTTGGFNNVGSYNQDHFPFVHSGGTSSDVSTFELTLNDLTSTTYYKTILARGISRDGSQWVFWSLGGMYRHTSNAVTGLKIYSGSGSNFTSGNYQLYGIK